MITLYSTHCPKCNSLERRLQNKKIEYNLIDDEEEVLNYGREHNMKSAPLMDVDGKAMDFIMAMQYVEGIK